MNDGTPTPTPRKGLQGLTESANLNLTALRALYPETPFLALGQTALWDEPTKATLRRLLDQTWPAARMIAGAHDTDYFAKLPGHGATPGHGMYSLALHDDAKTRGLWSAAGEMSRLFGSEDVPTRAVLEHQAGVSLHRPLSRAEDPRFLLSELTAAWGWTGIIYTHWDKKIVRDIPLGDILPTLLDQVDWATQGSIECLQGERAERAALTARNLRDKVTTFARQNPGASLADLYRDLLPRLYEMLLGTPPSNLSTSATSQLLRFNRDTAPLPRFRFVELFLNPITRRAAIDAYNTAVGGSDIYTLDQFANGALPFDLVIPGRGRGTICIPGDGTIYVDTRQPITLCDEGCDFASIEKLAALVERELGPDCVLVGKAVTLLPMLAAEYLLVFHEGASSYSERTRAMLERLNQRNIRVADLHPIVRLHYSTWEALAAAPTIETGKTEPSENAADAFLLPEHLSQAFGRETITLSHFADCWGYAINQEKKRLEELSALRSPRTLLAYLSRLSPSEWTSQAKAHETANLQLLELRNQAQSIQGRVYTFYDQVRKAKDAANRLERAKGDDFRARVRPLCDRLLSAKDPGEAETLEEQIAGLQSERAFTYDAEIQGYRSQVRYALAMVRDLKAKRLMLERGEAATQARDTLQRIEAEAELAKARLARNAYQTIHGLPHTDHRPSAWWFPLVDNTGSWFQKLCETTEIALEPLSPATKQG